MKNILKLIVPLSLLIVTSNLVLAEENVADVKQSTQASTSTPMTKSELETKIKEIDARGELDMADMVEKRHLRRQLIAIEEAETAKEEAETAQKDETIKKLLEIISIQAAD